MSGNKAMRRALETKDAPRLDGKMPLLTDETIGFLKAEALDWVTTKNRNNRPVNWGQVHEFKKIMQAGDWRLHGQGILLDEMGFILNGQTRLWAVVLADLNFPIYFRVSRGNRREDANLIDRGRPQSARDLATRKTDKKHSPTEASIARAICVLSGDMRPSTDAIAACIVLNSVKLAAVTAKTTGTKKTKALLMILAAICSAASTPDKAGEMAMNAERFVERLAEALKPQLADKCWGKGVAFSLALNHARAIVAGNQSVQ